MNEIPKARIFDIQRMSTEDGPGVRTTVFFKGCNLSCAWCHNPESISQKSEVEWIRDSCIGCLSCKDICEKKALKHGNAGILIDRSACISCLKCVEVCPANALISKTHEWDVGELFKEVIKDRVYFENGSGGVTVSGGEALLQHEFVGEFLFRLKKERIHTAVDTAGAVPMEILDKVIPYTDVILYDLKIMDKKQHKKYTGISNERILDNLKSIAGKMRNQGMPKSLWIRTPIIPGMTSDKENIRAIGNFISNHAQDVLERWELCSFNNLCKDKYERLNRKWLCDDRHLMSKQEMEMLAGIAIKSGVDEEKVSWSGRTKN